MATQLKVTEYSRRSNKFAPLPKLSVSPLTLTSKDSDSKKMVMLMKSHKVWLDKHSLDKQLELL